MLTTVSPSHEISIVLTQTVLNVKYFLEMYSRLSSPPQPHNIMADLDDILSSASSVTPALFSEINGQEM